MIRIQRAVQRRKRPLTLCPPLISPPRQQLLCAPAGETGQRRVQTQTVECAFGERATGVCRVSGRRHVKEGPLRRRRPGEHQVSLNGRNAMYMVDVA